MTKESNKSQYKCIHFSIPKDKYFQFENPLCIEEFGIPIIEKSHFRRWLKTIEQIVKDSYPQIKYVEGSVDNYTKEYLYLFLDENKNPMISINIYFAFPMLGMLVEKKLKEGMEILNQ